MGACWTAYCKCVVVVCQTTYRCIVFTKNKIKQCCACWWYPLKERCCNCCDRCDKYMNPYKDEAYSTI
ncbi:hypothetical protein SteCoe_19419 [Stentor coeruleus]|uniref:Uncharacterized protein n=1 Tax=Stentor coeruleus TaxID=5963 RepID=A0A1R2BU32_9CILI|nr:hypothetical protein SteCoe_19419 [Stentor coeruleus]